MSLDVLMQEVVSLDDSERRRLIAYMIALQEHGRADYREKLARKIDDASPGRWLSLEEVEREMGRHGDGHHDLDALIGTWHEDPAYETAQRAFGQVDETMWK